jgi:hypothetical protein
MITIKPVILEGHGIRLEPLATEHANDLRIAAMDGRLWELWYTFIPEPENFEQYIATALEGQAKGHMLPWVVRILNPSPSGRGAGGRGQRQ